MTKKENILEYSENILIFVLMLIKTENQNCLFMAYKNKIKIFLEVLSSFDTKKKRALDNELKNILEKEAGTNAVRYLNLKHAHLKLYHLEGVTVLNFFKKKFDEALENAQGERLNQLESYYPDSHLSIYYDGIHGIINHKQPVAF